MFEKPTALDNLMNKERQYEDAVNGLHEAYQNAVKGLHQGDTYPDIVMWIRRVKKQYFQYRDAKYRNSTFNIEMPSIDTKLKIKKRSLRGKDAIALLHKFLYRRPFHPTTKFHVSSRALELPTHTPCHVQGTVGSACLSC